MSCNITHSEYLSGKLTIVRDEAIRLRKEYCVEGNFLYEIDEDEPEIDAVIDRFWWYGEGSGRTYDNGLPEILSHTKGVAVILFVWEGGDTMTALEVKDGVVKNKKVKIGVEDE